MNWWALCGVLLIVAGELVAIAYEVLAMRHMTLRYTLWACLCVAGAGILLVLGYTMTFKGLKNAWVVSTVSILTILVSEPILVWLVFKEVPTLGPMLGLLCATVGFGCVLFVK